MFERIESVYFYPSYSIVEGSFVFRFKKYRFTAMVDPFANILYSDFDYSIVLNLSIIEHDDPYSDLLEYCNSVPLKVSNKIARKLVSYLSSHPVIDTRKSRVYFRSKDKKHVVAFFDYCVLSDSTINVYKCNSVEKYFSTGDSKPKSPKMLDTLRAIRAVCPSLSTF